MSTLLRTIYNPGFKSLKKAMVQDNNIKLQLQGILNRGWVKKGNKWLQCDFRNQRGTIYDKSTPATLWEKKK